MCSFAVSHMVIIYFQVHGRAELNRPPENIVFQEFFLPLKKRARAQYMSASIPEIHVHVNNHASPASTRTPSRTPLMSADKINTNSAFNSELMYSPKKSRHRTYRSVTPPSPSPQPGSSAAAAAPVMIAYPTVLSILEAIDSTGRYSSLDFPVVIFADELAAWSITNVSHVRILHQDFYISQIGMSTELAEEFVHMAAVAASRAEN